MSKRTLTSPSNRGLPPAARLPRVRVPMRVKITLPYTLLAVIFVLAGTYITSQVILDTIEERFNNQLIELGQLTADQLVQEEGRQLQTLRLAANTQGVADAIRAGDTEQLRNLILPLAANAHQEAMDVLDLRGRSLLSLRHQSGAGAEVYRFTQGDDSFRERPFVAKALAQQTDELGDKYAGLVSDGEQTYFYVAGPVFDAAGRPVGAVLVGQSVAAVVDTLRASTFAQTTIYDLSGQPIASSLTVFGVEPSAVEAVQTSRLLDLQQETNLMRPIDVSNRDFTEIIGAWQVRDGLKIALIGVAISQNHLIQPSQFTRLQIFGLVIVIFLTIVWIGIVLSRRITRPLQHVVQASASVAEGDLGIQVEQRGNDEVAVLAHAFNAMVDGLREGSVYRDLLGRTVSPEVREQLRQAFATGDLRLDGQNALATVLMTDVRGFTTLSEKTDPTRVLSWLNEYFADLLPLIAAYGGVVNKFEGDAIMAFFGILPRPLSAEESAYMACQAAIEMLDVIEQFNQRRLWQGEPVFITGIGIHTGMVTAGSLGAVDRLHYTIIGDTVNTTQRLESFTRTFSDSAVVISRQTLTALGARRQDFSLEPQGVHFFKGKSESVEIYRLGTADQIVADSQRKVIG